MVYRHTSPWLGMSPIHCRCGDNNKKKEIKMSELRSLIGKMVYDKSYETISQVAEAIYQDSHASCREAWSEIIEDDDERVEHIMSAIESHYVGDQVECHYVSDMVSFDDWSLEVQAPNKKMVSLSSLVLEEVIGGVS